MYLEELLGPDLRRRTNRNQSLTTLERIILALRFFATGSMQQVVGDTIRVSQPSASRSMAAVSAALVRRAGDFIKMPRSDNEIREVYT